MKAHRTLTLIWMAVDDLCEDVWEMGQRLDIVKLGGLDKRGDGDLQDS